MATDPYCDTYAIIPDPGCIGVPQDEPDPATPPISELPPGTVLAPDNGSASLARTSSIPWSCQILSWRPLKNADDKVYATHQASCSGGVIKFVLRGNLQRQKSFFFGIFTWWSTIATSQNVIRDGIGSITTETRVACANGGKGWWRANSILTITDIMQSDTAVGSSPHSYITCALPFLWF